jgi:hypothetical protein
MFTFHTQTQARMLPGTKRAPFVFDSERDTVVETIRTAHQGKPLLCIIWVCLSRVSLCLRFTHKQAHMLPGTQSAPFVFDSKNDTVIKNIRTAPSELRWVLLLAF